jgi:hypothetical protein
MSLSPRLRRVTSVLAVAAMLGLGTFGLLHLYEDVALLNTDRCLTCHVIVSSPTLTAAPATLGKPVMVLARLAVDSVAAPTLPLLAGPSARGPPSTS